METPWLRAIRKTINLQGCTKYPETEKPAGTANSIFSLHIPNHFPALDFRRCHKMRRRQLVLHGKRPSQTHLPSQRRFWVNFHSSQEYPRTFLLSRAWLHPRRNCQAWPETISRADLSLSQHWGLGFALSWSPIRAEGGWSRSSLPSSTSGKRKKRKITHNHRIHINLLMCSQSSKGFSWLTHLCLLQPYEEGSLLAPFYR